MSARWMCKEKMHGGPALVERAADARTLRNPARAIGCPLLPEPVTASIQSPTYIRECAMRAVTSCGIALALLGCSKPAEKPADTAETAAAPEAPAPAAVSLADMAGTWHVTSKVEGSDKVVTYDLVTTADQNGWSLKF